MTTRAGAKDIFTKAETAPINTYDKNDPSLVDQVMMTRRAVSLSFLAAVSNKDHQWELSENRPLFPQQFGAEIESLKDQLSRQIKSLGIDLSQNFTLSQDQSGNMLIDSGDSNANQQIATTLNASDSFKQVFHLLKTAENALDVAKGGDDLADRAFSLDVTAGSLTSHVTVLQTQATNGNPRNTAKIMDSEMYLLARTGLSAKPMRYINVKI